MAMSKEEKLLHQYQAAEQWAKAAKVCERVLKKEDSHWWYIHYGMSLIELGKFKQAKKVLEKADEGEGYCPLTQWYKGVLHYEQKHWALALEIFEEIHKRSLRILRPDNEWIPSCWESEKRVEELDNDCRGRIGFCWLHLGNKRKSAWWLKQHLLNRKKGRFSIYSARTVQGYIRDMEKDDG